MKYLLLTFTLTLFALAACNNITDSGSSDDSITAPTSVSGKRYSVAIVTGSGRFAKAGTATVQFNADQTFVVIGDNKEVEDESGTYTYSASGKVGTAVVRPDSNGVVATYLFTYTASASGTYAATIDADTASIQAGTFKENE